MTARAVAAGGLSDTERSVLHVGAQGVQSLLYQMRLVTAIVLDCVYTPVTHATAVAVRAKGTWYHGETSGRRGHKLGQPGPYMFVAALLSLKLCKNWANQELVAEVKVITDFIESDPNATVMQGQVRVCRFKMCANRTHGHLQVATRGLEQVVMAAKAILSLGEEEVEVRNGMAPPSAAERHLTELLDQLSQEGKLIKPVYVQKVTRG